jgi:hypothetical protein
MPVISPRKLDKGTVLGQMTQIRAMWLKKPQKLKELAVSSVKKSGQ